MKHAAEGEDVAASVRDAAPQALRGKVGPGSNERTDARERRLSVASVGVSNGGPPAVGSRSPSCARPKSSSLAPARVSMTFAGLRSRCTMPRWCAAASAPASWLPSASTSGTGSAPRSSRAASVSPSSLSITRYAMLPSGPSALPTSKSAQTCGWLSAEIARASRSKRARRSGSEASSCGNALTATSLSSRVSRAVKTFAHAPGAQGTHDFVGAESLARRQAHGRTDTSGCVEGKGRTRGRARHSPQDG